QRVRALDVPLGLARHLLDGGRRALGTRDLLDLAQMMRRPQPAADELAVRFEMELQPIRSFADAKSLILAARRAREVDGIGRQLEGIGMPLEDLLGPGEMPQQRVRGRALRRRDLVPADLDRLTAQRLAAAGSGDQL